MNVNSIKHFQVDNDHFSLLLTWKRKRDLKKKLFYTSDVDGLWCLNYGRGRNNGELRDSTNKDEAVV